MALDINSPALLIAALEQTPATPSFFRSTFFPRITTSPTEEVLIDYRKGSRRMAPFVTPNSGGVDVSRTGFQTKKYKPPLMLPKIPTRVTDLNQRGFGETILAQKTAAQRAMDLRTQDLLELRALNERRTEWMCAQLMVTGQVKVVGYSDDGKTKLEDIIQYDFTQKETLTGTAVWSNSASTPMADILRAHDTISSNTSANADVMIMDTATEAALFANEKFLKLLDTKYLQVANFVPKVQAPGIRYLGNLYNMEVYVYIAEVIDDDGQLKKLLPDGHVIIGISGRGLEQHGAVTQIDPVTLEFVTYEGQDIPKVWADVEKDTKVIRLARRVMPVPECIDDWYTLSVL